MTRHFDTLHTQSVSGPHRSRRTAQRIERELTATLEKNGRMPDMPVFTRGFRVMPIGPRRPRNLWLRQWHVEATSSKGH